MGRNRMALFIIILRYSLAESLLPASMTYKDEYISDTLVFFLLIFPTYYFVSFLAKIQNYSWITWYACDERKKTVFCNQKI